MRFLGVDFGRKRIGLALSDPTATLARPWQAVAAGATPLASAAHLQALIVGLRADDDGLAGIVVGLPRRLDGRDTEQTAPARAFAAALSNGTGLAVHFQDERLSSREAESRLAEREPDWRVRKKKIDAAAAAVILQDFLDERGRAYARVSGNSSPDAEC